MIFVKQSYLQSEVGKSTDYLQMIIGACILLMSGIWLIQLLIVTYRKREAMRNFHQLLDSINSERTRTNIRTDYYRYILLTVIIISELLTAIILQISQMYHVITYKTHFNSSHTQHKYVTNCTTITEGFINQYYSDWVYRLSTALATVLYTSTFVEIAILNSYLATAYRQCTQFRTVRILSGWLIIQAVIVFICRYVRVLYHLLSVVIFIVQLLNWLLVVKYGKELYTTLKSKSMESDIHGSNEFIKRTNERVYKRNKKLFILVSSVLFIFILSEFLDLVVNTFAEAILLNSCTLFAGLHIPILINLSTNAITILNNIFDVTKEMRETIFTVFLTSLLLLYFVIPLSYLVYKLRIKKRIRFYGTHPYRIHVPLIPDYYAQND